MKVARLTGVAFLAGLVATAAFAQGSRGIEQTFADSLTEVPAQGVSTNGSVYVPVYSSVSMAQGKARADFSVTLSIHNAARDKPLVITRIAYFDTAGQLVESYLQKTVALKPFAAIEIFIAQNDVRGGTGPNFVVDWAAAGAIAEPVIEALMVGGIGAGHYAFISQGRPIKVVGGN